MDGSSEAMWMKYSSFTIVPKKFTKIEKVSNYCGIICDSIGVFTDRIQSHRKWLFPLVNAFIFGRIKCIHRIRFTSYSRLFPFLEVHSSKVFCFRASC